VKDERADAGKLPEHIGVYQRIRSVFGDPSMRSSDARKRRATARDETSVPYGLGRDPRGVGDVLGNLTAEMGWDSPIAQAEMIAGWPKIVGENIAGHTTPVGIENGTLTIRCDSSPWATELRRLKASITTKLMSEFPTAGIDALTIIGPNTPSWNHGPRAIPGRGPRDTYG
jgi:predicted nucleic acid-binding Zn ribbon protein